MVELLTISPPLHEHKIENVVEMRRRAPDTSIIASHLSFATTAANVILKQFSMAADTEHNPCMSNLWLN